MGVRLVGRGHSAERVRRSAFRILDGNVLCSMATVTRAGRAHVNTAYYCFSNDLALYFLSDPGAGHCRNLSSNPSMAMTIFRSAQRWGRPDRGMQLFGTCREARGREAERAERLYGKRFPAYTRWIAGRGRNAERLAAALRRYRFYRFVPARLKILDEAEFGGAVFVTAAVRRDPRLPA